ncbi:hypothetical protein V8D89_001772 [Ganoderma adspersum]
MSSPQLFDEYDVVIAGAGPSLRVLMLEAGPPTKDDLPHIQPARYLSHILPDSDTVKHVVGKPSDDLNGRRLAIQCGQCTFAYAHGAPRDGVYTQPGASDYDDWANVHNNPGWSFDELLPLIKKHWLKWIEQETGRRSDVAHSYIHPALDGSQNVHLLLGCAVRKVIIEDGRATGVEYVLNTKMFPDAGDTPRVVRATKLAVLSAGTFGSPAILERSGIGARDVLERNGIVQVVDLPGVVENYNDHPLILMPFLGKDDADSLHPLAQGHPSEREKWSAKWHEDGQGSMGANGLDGVVRFRPSEAEARAIGPEFAEQYSGASPPPAHHKVYVASAYCSYPAGIGSMHTISAYDVDSPTDFNTGANTLSITLSSHLAAQRGYRQTIMDPSPSTKEDDEAINNLLKANIVTAWNSLGTCAMKPCDKGGVVDSHPNVYDMQNLKIADMSICPSVIAANGCATGALVGEKAAVIIGEEMGIAQSPLN